jgi:hypothetical protein
MSDITREDELIGAWRVEMKTGDTLISRWLATGPADRTATERLGKCLTLRFTHSTLSSPSQGRLQCWNDLSHNK